MKKIRLGTFATAVVTIVIVYAIVKWGIPMLSREVTTLPFPLPVPGALMFIYMTLVLIALFLLITFSDEGLNDFLRPVNDLLGIPGASLSRGCDRNREQKQETENGCQQAGRSRVIYIETVHDPYPC